MADRSGADQLFKISLLKNLSHQPHPALRAKGFPIVARCDDAGTLLPTML
jgi:hypothetical protein